jgi:putative transposase
LIDWAFSNLGTAYQNFYRRVKAGVSGKEVGHPKFKRRGGHDSFGIRGYRTDKGRIWLGSRIGWVRFSEQDYIPPDIKYREGGATYVVISREADHWFVSVSVEQEIVQPPLNDLVLGIDLGISHLAVLSNGRVFENPKPLGQALRKLQRLDKELSRRKRGSQNWKKTKRKLARAHYKVKCIRLDAQHQISYYVTYMVKPAVIAI